MKTSKLVRPWHALAMAMALGCQASSAMDAAVPHCKTAPLARTASAQLLKAEQLIQQRTFSAALSALDHGISLLGQSYYREGSEDDTGQKMLLSKIEQEGGRLERAAHLRQSVLSSRIAAYLRALPCKQ